MESDLGLVCTKLMMTDIRRTMFITLQNLNPRVTKCPGIVLDFASGERVCYQLTYSGTAYLEEMTSNDELDMLSRHNEIILLIQPIMRSLRPNDRLLTISMGDLRLNDQQEMYMPSAYCKEDVSAMQ